MVKTWARHETTEAVLNNGWRLAAVGGWQRLAVGGNWRLVAVGGGWRLVVVDGRRLAAQLAVGGGWRLAVGGGWWWAAVGGWRLAAGGSQGLSLTKEKKEFLRTALGGRPVCGPKRVEAGHPAAPVPQSCAQQSRPPPSNASSAGGGGSEGPRPLRPR